MPEFMRLANAIVDLVGSQGIHVEVYRSHGDSNWCELVAVTMEGETFRVEGDDLYFAACVLAEQVGIDLIDG
jgi:hypothetical protein